MTYGNKKIYVLPVPRESAQGRGSYSLVSSSGNYIPMGRQVAKGVTITLGFVERAESPSRLYTGLDDLVTNPYYEQELGSLPSDIRPGTLWEAKYPTISKMEKISKQTLFEILDNVPENFYTASKNIGGMYTMYDGTTDNKEQPNFLEKFKIYLEDGVNVFTSETSRGRLGIQVCETHPLVARVKEQINPDIHRFYIGSEQEALVEKNERRSVQTKALGKLAKVYEEYPEFLAYQFAIVLDLVKGTVTNASVKLALDDFLWEQKKTAEGTLDERITRFNSIFDEFEKDKDMLNIRYLVKQAFNANVISNVGGSMFWRSKKSIENLYKLGTNIGKIETMFYNELLRYDPMSEEDNWYIELVNELESKGVKCK